jgi:hypothetical protein
MHDPERGEIVRSPTISAYGPIGPEKLLVIGGASNAFIGTGASPLSRRNVMATINSKRIIDELIANNGMYEDDPQASQIVEYITPEGNTTWGVTWVSEIKARQRRYEIESDFVRKPKVIWRKPV